MPKQPVDDTEGNKAMSTTKTPLCPNGPTERPVKQSCEHKYTGYLSFYHHWERKHQVKVSLYTCSGCNHSFGHHSDTTRHTNHVEQGKFIALKSEESKRYYEYPAGNRPYKVHRRQREAQKRKQMAEVSLGDRLVTERADCRDEVILFDEKGATIGKTFKGRRT